ncbi:molybdopterin-dependent oxidoreductase [Paenibacillus sacheonensis]|uniref:Molybdopterin-dependent oxidoreductase n=1 Tax=Paenibacillus sacheonensis TaxID=742054 RepID=A0A7X5BWJ3_9BACL|nr:molybdopterin-dependent oxidoreductase [Paenibacillus sacheonensis]MBM7565568.1 anaerobic selenocysteine-containing dehydrogenase [Paenibacillus sacheonensis]NBC69513.1 molybdopterin-dependent oxidoreductase [Paenibacillus sacheonensis]
MSSYTEQANGVFPSVCSLDCPDQCGLLVHKQDHRIVKIEGDPSHPVTQGAICNKVRNMTARIYDEKRLQYPLRRTGPKGSGQFERISWEEAVEEITSRWKKLIAEEGPESILPYSFYGNMGRINTEGMGRRFFNRMNASRLIYSICEAAGTVGYGFTMGGSYGVDPEDTVHAKVIIMWGINAVSTNMHQVTLAEKARKNGAKVVVIDVHRNRTAKWGDWFIPIQPGTDAALALGMMHVLFDEHLVDEAFMKRYTVGHEELREHVKTYTPEFVSAITGVPAEDIVGLARMYGTVDGAAFIRIGNGPQHHDNGGMTTRTISCLPALTGQWLKKGGGAIKGNGGHLALNRSALERSNLKPRDAVHPRSINMNLIGSALLELERPISSLYVYNANPAVVAPQAGKVREGLAREDLFTVVHELFMTETAKYADIVLPATSAFENTDLYSSYWHHYVQIQEPVIAPYGESKSNADVFRLLAQAMGYGDDALRDGDLAMIDQALDNPNNPNLQGITAALLQERQFAKAEVKPILPGKLRTPSGRIELYSASMERQGFPALPTYVPLVDDGPYPFLFIPTANHNFLNSTFSHNGKHAAMEKSPKLYMNAADAGSLGILDGDAVRVWNGRGECELTAVVGEDVLPGVVVSQGLWADGAARKAVVNALTPDRVADMGQGATFFSGRVGVARAV